ncbi:MAG: hypothetical protein SH808_08480 [Saprospiraceae bacterium]|nr:hypothetical protein [Saprospiraceae bacterium]
MKKADRSETRINLAIIVLLQAVIYSGIWLWNEYVAAYLTFIFPGVILVILIIAGLADLIEPSRIPGWYYGLMFISIITPLIIGAVFYFLYEGRLDWLV